MELGFEQFLRPPRCEPPRLEPPLFATVDSRAPADQSRRWAGAASAWLRQRPRVWMLTPTSREICSSDAFSGGSSLATVRSLKSCPNRAMRSLLQRPQVEKAVTAKRLWICGRCAARTGLLVVDNELLRLASGAAVTMNEAQRKQLELMASGQYSEADFANAWRNTIVPKTTEALSNVAGGFSDGVKQRYLQQGGRINPNALITPPGKVRRFNAKGKPIDG